MKAKKVKKLINAIYEQIESKLDGNRGIKKLDIKYSIDGANNPEIEFKLKTYSKV